MGRLTSTLVLVVVLAGLGGYIYFVESERDPNAADALPRAFEVSPENIEELEIRNAEGETLRVRRVDGSWQITEPETADADAGVVGTVTSGLAGLEKQRVLEEPPTDLAQYGLSPARIELAFRETDSDAFERLLVGEKTPTGGDLYAKRPDEDEVFLIAAYLDSIFNKRPFDLRDKAVLRFDRNNASTIELTWGGDAVSFTQVGTTDWRILQPITARADYSAVEGVLTRLGSTQMDAVVEAQASDLSEYGLDPPSLTATVSGGSSTATLSVGREGDEGFFAKDSGRPAVFTVDATFVEDLRKGATEYRRRDLFDGRSFTANRIDLTRDGETITLEKTAGEEETWRNAAGEDLETTAVEALMRALTGIRAESFEDSAPAALDAPVLAVTIRFDESRIETVTFGRSDDEAFAARTDEPGAARIDAGMLEEAIAALDDLN